jgi:hypothetical protein
MQINLDRVAEVLSSDEFLVIYAQFVKQDLESLATTGKVGISVLYLALAICSDKPFLKLVPEFSEEEMKEFLEKNREYLANLGQRLMMKIYELGGKQ